MEPRKVFFLRMSWSRIQWFFRQWLNDNIVTLHIGAVLIVDLLNQLLELRLAGLQQRLRFVLILLLGQSQLTILFQVELNLLVLLADVQVLEDFVEACIYFF